MPSRLTTPGATTFAVEVTANARLIAAAPELLDACRRVAARAAETLNAGTLSPNDIRAVHIAIAKAEP